jgi:hypothetical protein
MDHYNPDEVPPESTNPEDAMDLDSEQTGNEESEEPEEASSEDDGSIFVVPDRAFYRGVPIRDPEYDRYENHVHEENVLACIPPRQLTQEQARRLRFLYNGLETASRCVWDDDPENPDFKYFLPSATVFRLQKMQLALVQIPQELLESLPITSLELHSHFTQAYVYKRGLMKKYLGVRALQNDVDAISKTIERLTRRRVFESFAKDLCEPDPNVNYISFETECAICKDDVFEHEDKTKVYLPVCRHIILYECLEKHFLNNTSCPLCREKYAEVFQKHDEDLKMPEWELQSWGLLPRAQYEFPLV